MSEVVDRKNVDGKVVLGLSWFQADLIFIVFAGVFLYLLLFILPTSPIYYEMDHVALLNDSKRMVEGEVIYRDFFEFVFPGSHVLYAFSLELFGPKYWVANLLILLHGLASATICLFLSRRIIGRNLYSYLPAAIYLFFGFRWFGIDGEHRMFSPLFGYLAVIVLLKAATPMRVAIAGAFCALCGFFTQQRGIVGVTAIAVYLAYEYGFRNREWKRFITREAVLASSFLVSLALMLAPFIVMAGPESFFRSTIFFLSSYVQDPATNSLATFTGTIAKLGSIGYLITAVAVFYHLLIPLVYLISAAVLWLDRRRSEINNERAVLLICLIGIFFALGTFAPNAGRLFQISVPAVVLFGWLVFRICSQNALLIKAVLVFLILFGAGQGIRMQTAWDRKVLNTVSGDLVFLSPVLLERYLWLLEHTSPGEYVFETYNSHVNFPLGLKNPSQVSILLNTGYTPPEQVAQSIIDLKTKKPRYIIWDGSLTAEMQTLHDGEKLKPFYDFMTQEYELRLRTTPYDGREREIWELKSGSSGEKRTEAPFDGNSN
jgi:hypothetical protein